MKKKIYNKQRKISDVPDASTDAYSLEAEEQTTSKEVTDAIGSSQMYSDKHPSTVASPSVASSLSASPNSTASSTISLAPMTRSISNTAPLPKVDVLMKASLRAFQIADNRNNGHPEKPPLVVPPHAENIAPDEQMPNQSDIWRKESAVTASPDLQPLSNSHFDLEYTRPAGFEIRETSVDVIKRESRDPSPVYHQMERPVQPAPDPGMYPTHPTLAPEYTELHGPVNGLHNAIHNVQVMNESPGMIQLHEMGPYSHDSSSEQPGGDHLQSYGHIRAWEQENARYVDYAWRREEHQDDAEFGQSDSGDDSANDINIDRREQKTKRNSARIGGFGKVGGNSTSSRRRRKRVQTPVQRSAANMRERRRMCHLNVAFDHLKDHLPHVKDKKKLSRIQTLKAAIYYIHLLQDSLNTAPRG